MKNLFFLLFVVWGLTGTAQNQYTSGYIITVQGDTIHGFILEKSDAEMSRRIFFKISEEAEVQKHSTNTLWGFGLDSGREFEKRTMFPLSGNPRDTTYIFAKNMLQGNIDVYTGRHFQMKKPTLFIDNNSQNQSIQIYRSKNAEALNMDEFLAIFLNAPESLKDPLGVKFREKRLLKHIAHHNQTMRQSFPVEAHREHIKFDWNFLAGLPVDYRKDVTHLRGGIFLNRTNIERTPNFAALFGIIYHHWERRDISLPQGLSQVDINEKWQMLNVMPIAVKIQANTGNIRPYGYIGAGAALIKRTDISVEDNIVTGENIRWKFLPTINSGVGLKTRIGKQYLVTELTPTINNVFLNMGLSI